VILLLAEGTDISPPLLGSVRRITLKPYSDEECAMIAWAVWGKLGINASSEACALVGRRAQGVAAKAVRYAREAHDAALRKGVFKIDAGIAGSVLL